MTLKALPIFALLAAAPALPAPAEDLASADRIAAIELRVAGLLDGFGFANDSDPAPARGQADAPAELSLRVAAIENQLRRVTGEVERLSHQLRLLEDQLKRADAEPRGPDTDGPRAKASAPPAAETPRLPQQAAVQPAAPAPGSAQRSEPQRGEPQRGELPRELGHVPAP